MRLTLTFDEFLLAHDAVNLIDKVLLNKLE
jgi:hypothetical protein